MESTSTFVLKLPRFFTRLYALWEKLPYFRSCLKRPIFRKKCHSLQNVHQFCKKSKNQLFFLENKNKISTFFHCDTVRGKSVAISELRYIWTPSSRSYIVLALNLQYVLIFEEQKFIQLLVILTTKNFSE